MGQMSCRGTGAETVVQLGSGMLDVGTVIQLVTGALRAGTVI